MYCGSKNQEKEEEKKKKKKKKKAGGPHSKQGEGVRKMT